jgi:hypothetical protein
MRARRHSGSQRAQFNDRVTKEKLDRKCNTKSLMAMRRETLPSPAKPEPEVKMDPGNTRTINSALLPDRS